MGDASESNTGMRIGGSVALDFLNSTMTPKDEPIESIGTFGDLLRWMLQSRLIDQQEAQKIQAVMSPRDLARLASEAQELRERFRAILPRVLEKGFGGLLDSDIRYFNDIFRRSPIKMSLELRAKNNLLLLPTREWVAVDEVLALLVQAFIELIRTEKPSDIKRCANPACTMWFVDRTKARRRQWCSQAICGNRAKVAAFRNRAKKNNAKSQK